MRLEEQAFALSDVVGSKFVWLNRLGVADLEDARSPNGSVKRHLMKTAASWQEVKRAIHMGTGMRPHGQRRDRAYISTLHMQHVFNAHWWIVGPVYHTSMKWYRNVNPVVSHLPYSLLVA